MLNAICSGTGRGSGGSSPQLWGRVYGAPKPARTEKLLLFYIFVSFLSVKRPKDENKWPKIDEKTSFGDTLGLFLS